MLLIGQPKSASTSLGRTLCDVMGIKYCNGIGYRRKENKKSKEFKTLQSYHTSMLVVEKDVLKGWMKRKDWLIKDHILPLEDHIKTIKDSGEKVVILTRTPEHCLDNYKRMYLLYKSKQMSDKEVKELKPKLLSEVNWDGLLDDLKKFRDGWLKADISNAYYIDFDELVLCPKRTLLEMVKHYGRPLKKRIRGLLKARGNWGYNTYTGVGEKRVKKMKGLL